MQNVIWLRKVPMIRILIPFIIGIIVQIYISFSLNNFIWVLFLSALIVLAALWLKKITENYRFRWFTGFSVSLFMFFLGLFVVKQNQVNLPELDLNEKQYITARIVESPEEKEKSIKIIVKFIAVEDSSGWEKLSGKALIYLEKDSLSKILKFGDEIVFNATINEVTNSGNPHEFDYKKYLKNQKIVTQTYLSSGNWEKIRTSKKDFLMLQANRARDYLLKVYKRYNFGEKEYAVLSALTLGYKADFDDETIRAYSATGAMHILSVSGLHVGVVYLILNFIFGFMDKSKKLKYLKFVIIIISLWGFAYISGLAPSVRRSAIMFTLFLIGDIFSRDKNSYNIIASSMFMMLIFNPFVISDIGFQLSYIAVLSIIYFQPKIYNAIYVKNKFWDKVWQLLSVSIAAQLGTMPIGLFYFHQFPNYFFITNIVAVPLSSLILYGAVGLLFVSFYNPIAKVVAFLLDWCLKSLNFSIDFIDKLPFSCTKNIFISLPQMLLFYLIIFGFTFLLLTRQKKYLFASLSVVLIFLLTDTYQEIKALNQKKAIVYNVKNSCSINFISGKNNYLLCDTVVENNSKTIDFIFKNNWLQHSISKYEIKNIDTLQKNQDTSFCENPVNEINEFVQFFDKKILIMREKTFAENVSDSILDLDYIILSNNIYISISDLLENFNTKTIIFDSSNKSWRIERWKEECTALNIEYYSVPDSGAFILEL